MITTYAIMAIIATVLLIGYCALVRKKEPLLLLLYVCVTIAYFGSCRSRPSLFGRASCAAYGSACYASAGKNDC